MVRVERVGLQAGTMDAAIVRPNLLERLDRVIVEESDKYLPDCVDRVKQFIEFESANPHARKPYRLFEDIADFGLYYQLHPEWHGKPTKQMNYDTKSGLSAFYQATVKWTRKKSNDNSEKRVKLMKQVFPHMNAQWSHITTLDVWREEMQKHPEWAERSPVQMQEDVESGACKFLQAYTEWARKESGGDRIKKRELMGKLFHYQAPIWSTFTTLEEWTSELEKHPNWIGKTAGEFAQSSEEQMRSFFHIFRYWVAKIANGNKERRRELTKKVFQASKWTDWSGFTTLEDWINEFNAHPDWQGKTPTHLNRDTSFGGQAYYAAFNKWVKNVSTDREQELVYRKRLFPTMRVLTRSNHEMQTPISPQEAREELEKLLEVKS